MEIRGQLLNIKTTTNERPQQLQEGEVYRAKIESRISDREALISIRGQEVKAKFSGNVPGEDRITVKIEGKTEDGVRVKPIQEDGQNQNGRSNQSGRTAENHVDRILRDLGQRQPSAELRQAAQRMLDQSIPLTKDTVRDMNRYIEQEKGTKVQRMETVEMLAKKHLVPSKANIDAVHEFLHGKKLSDHLVGNSPRLEQDSQWKQGNSPSIIPIDRGQSAGEVNDRISQIIQQVQTINGNDMSQRQPGVGDNTDFINLQKMIQNEPDLNKAIDKIKESIATGNMQPILEKALSQGLVDAENKLDHGRELKARQILIESIQRVESLISTSINHSRGIDARNEMLQYVSNEILQSTKLQSKDILVTEITERLAVATDEFKAFQRDVTSQLSRIQLIIQQYGSQSVQQTKPMLENVIRELDNALLKNDWLLFADMKTEKKVLEASSSLAEAKKLLAKGMHNEARQIVRQVQQTLDSLKFKPSDQKVVHHLNQELEWRESKPGVHQLSTQMENTARSLTYNQGSGREVFEGLRQMGLNREAELGQFLSSGKEMGEGPQERNIKALLLQSLRGEEEGSRFYQQTQQSLANLTGQQLMSRNDHQQNMQMLLFQLPMMLKGAAENLQVFVNSRNDGEKIDWENCSLYFLIDTKKMGEVGISLNVTERSLNVTLKNDDPLFRNKVEPFAKKYMDRLEDVGFRVHGLHYSKMTNSEKNVEKTEDAEVQFPTMTPKGFDYKI